MTPTTAGEPRPDGPPDPAPARELSRRSARTASVVAAIAGVALLAAAAWEARAPASAAGALDPADASAAADTVYMYLALSSHLRGTGGDPRFAERLPASEQVVDEILRDLAFLRHASRAEEPRLVRAEVREVRPGRDGGATVRMREFWVTRDLREGGGTRSDVLVARYELRREAGGWRIAGWDVETGGEAGAGTGAAGR